MNETASTQTPPIADSLQVIAQALQRLATSDDEATRWDSELGLPGVLGVAANKLERIAQAATSIGHYHEHATIELDKRLAELEVSLAKHTQATALAAEVIATRLETLDITGQLIAGILARDTRAEAPKLTQLSAIVQWQHGQPPAADGRYLVVVNHNGAPGVHFALWCCDEGWESPEIYDEAPVLYWAELPEPPAQV